MITVDWKQRMNPLKAVAVAGIDDASKELASRLLRPPSVQTSQLRGVSSDRLIILLGEEDVLPWVDGAIFLGQEEKSQMLVPTNIEPSVPVVLIEQSLLKRFPDLIQPFALLPSRGLIVPLVSAKTISIDLVRTWLEKS